MKYIPKIVFNSPISSLTSRTLFNTDTPSIIVGREAESFSMVRNICFSFSSRSLKLREKWISFAQFVYFLREMCLLFNTIIQKLKSKHTSLKKYTNWELTEQNWYIFLSFWGNERRKKPNISHLIFVLIDEFLLQHFWQYGLVL